MRMKTTIHLRGGVTITVTNADYQIAKRVHDEVLAGGSFGHTGLVTINGENAAITFERSEVIALSFGMADPL